MKLFDALRKHGKKIDLTVKICAAVLTFVFAIIATAHPIMFENSAAINRAFNVRTTRQETIETDEEIDSEYFKSEHTSVASVRQAGLDIIEEVMSEGATLLKNDNNALPLAKGSKVAFYSASSVEPVIAGTGSSGTSNSPSGDSIDATTFKDAFEAEGMVVNAELWKFYNSNKTKYLRKKSGPWGAYFSISDAPWTEIPAAVKDAQTDAAIFVLSRRSGEGNDMGSYYGNDMVKDRWGIANDMTAGNYLALSPNELSVLKGLKEQKEAGKVGSIIVLMNSANPVQCDFADDPALGVDALMWCGNLGETGAAAIAKLMSGRIAPSGRLSDTFFKYHHKNPVNANFGIDMYHSKEWMEHVPVDWRTQAAADPSDAAMKANMIKNSRSTVYAEGIYVGYRYTETRYEDSVMGTANTGDFDYYDAVSYPFGYGLSYTGFAYSDFKVERINQTADMEDSEYEITLKVTNTGNAAAKEAVQIYLQKPYTEHDVYAEIEKASVELVAFEKTEVLEPGESVTVGTTVKERELACYDSKVAGTYILEAGSYYFTVGKDAHDAVNNILKAKSGSYETVAKGNSGKGVPSLASLVKIGKDDYNKYSVSNKARDKGVTSAPTKIENQFDAADIRYYEGAVSDDFRYITRSDWEGTVKYGFDENGNKLNTQVRVTVTDAMYEDRKDAMADPEPDDGVYPTMGKNDAETHLNLIDLRVYADDDDDPTNDVRVAYNDPLWDKLLDQVSWEELTYLLSEGWRLTRGIASINKPDTIDFNGSVGLVCSYSVSEKNNRGLAVSTKDPDRQKLIGYYSSNGIAASTFNKELMRRYGEQWGEDSLWSGSNGLYGMGLNLHRSAYGGRNFEYFSEDPYLMGMIAAQMVIGSESKGMYCYLKHCVLNEQETYRIGGYCWLTEQTIREIYLKPFRIAIEDGGASCVMTAEPAIGVRWSGQQGFVQTVLRNEFGMTGIAVSDYTRDVDGNNLKALLAGSDLPDGTINDLFDNISGTDGYGELATAMRESAHRICYTVVHSNAMNGMTANTRIIVLTPAWMTAMNALLITFTTLFVLSTTALVLWVAFGVIDGILSKRKQSNERAE